jgi:RNA polymerase sigma factor (TIGR02999 family)
MPSAEDPFGMSSEPANSVTTLLIDLQRGRTGAVGELLPLVYEELRALAAAYLRGERKDHTLQPTALVHEAFLKLVDQRSVTWQDRAHFFGIAAQAMRRVLVDHARRRNAQKRSGDRNITLPDDLSVTTEPEVDVVRVGEALERLAQLDERQARIVEMRFFGGLTIEETAEVLGISAATVKRDWQLAKAWLHRELSG